MLITKRSRRRSEIFDSRFRDGKGVDFPLRQYLRCREDFFSSIVHLVVLAAFVVTLCFFATTVGHLFDKHGSHLHSFYRWGAMGLVWLFALVLVRRLFRKFGYLRETRQEMKRLQEEIKSSGTPLA